MAGKSCQEGMDGLGNWRNHPMGQALNHVAPDAIVILEVFSKKTQATPVQIVEVCQRRLAAYWRAISDKEYT